MSLLQQKKKSMSLLSLLAIAGLALHALALLILMIQGIRIRQLSLRQPANFVQLVAGQQLIPEDRLFREPEAIQRFVNQTMTLMFNWSGMLPAQSLEEVSKPQRDQGLFIPTPQGGNQKISTNSWVASFALSEDFRKGFLREIAAMTPPEVFAGSPTQKISAQLQIKRLDPPQSIVPGKWRVGMVADLIQTRQSNGQKLIVPFNKDLLVRAIDYFPYSSPSNLTDLQKAIYSMRIEQLEIYEIRNLCLLDNNSRQSVESAGCPSPTGGFLR